MTDRIGANDEMDGTLGQFAADVARPLRSPVYITEGFQSRTMATIRREQGARKPWLFAPMTFRVAPIGAFALAAAMLVAVALGAAALGRSNALHSRSATPAAVASSSAVVAPDTIRLVRFQLSAPGASSVALVGDFNDWARDAITLHPADKPGVWIASVPLTAGRHEYAFIVDGKRWVADPYAITHRDEYNVESSVIHVGESGS